MKRSLRFLLENAPLPILSVSIVAAELQPAPATAPDVAKALHDTVWVFINQAELGEHTVLLPNVVPSLGHGCFYLEQAKGLQAGRALAERIEKEIGECRLVRNYGCRVRTQVESFDFAAAAETTDLEKRIAEVNDWTAQTISRLSPAAAWPENTLPLAIGTSAAA